MIKTVISLEPGLSHDAKVALAATIEEWLTENFGPAVTRDNNKMRRRKLWSTTMDYWGGQYRTGGQIDVYSRTPEIASMVALRWL